MTIGEHILVATYLGPMEATMVAGEPPLVVSIDPFNGYYNVTHVPSGYCIGYRSYKTKRAAATAREAMLGLLDWTRSRTAIQRQVYRDPELRQKIIDAR